MRQKINKQFLISVVILVISGLVIFSSASLGLLTRDGARFSSVAFNQIVFGLLLGILAMLISIAIPYRYWRKYAFYIFLLSVFLTLAVYIPGIGFEYGGAKRWIHLGDFSFQPSEFLKIGFIIYLAAWLSGIKSRITSIRYAVIPFAVILGLAGLILLSEPDTDNFFILALTGIAMFFSAGARLKHIALIVLISAVGFAAFAYTKPYIITRITTFFDSSRDIQGASWQIQQSYIAIGSGGFNGRGFGQSVQKFNYLPEPMGDSVFAVQAEEFGFLGSVSLVALFLFFFWSGLKIAENSPDLFSGLLAFGIVILITAQSFINIASMLGVFPLSGIPLPFISQGGTALFVALAEAGIVLNISKYSRKRGS